MSTKQSTNPPKPGTRPVGFRAQKSTGPPKGEVTKPTVASSTTNAAPPVATTKRSAPPMKKRGKGNGFLGMLFLIAFGTVGYYVWSQLLQYESYGVIEGRVISVAAPWDGTITSWQVRDGEEVKQGQVLAQIRNIAMDHELAGLNDELKMNQARLDAEISKVKFEVQDNSDRSQVAVSEYLKSAGELLSEKAKSQELERKFQRTKRLAKSNNVSRSAYEEIFFQLAGQRKKVEKLEESVAVLKQRSKTTAQDVDDGSSRLKPILAQIQLTQSEIVRLRERINQGQIKAPVSGRVSKRHCLTGESTRDGESVIELLEDNSIEAVLYVPQRITDEFKENEEIDIILEPHDRPLRCTIQRFGDRFQTPPESIRRYYFEHQPLLPVYLTPSSEAKQVMSQRIGGTVKRPYAYKKAIGNLAGEWKQSFDKHFGPEETLNQYADRDTQTHRTKRTDAAPQQGDFSFDRSSLEQPAAESNFEFERPDLSRSSPANELSSVPKLNDDRIFERAMGSVKPSAFGAVNE